MAELLGRPVGELLATMTSYEISEWKAYLDLKAEAEARAIREARGKS